VPANANNPRELYRLRVTKNATVFTTPMTRRQ
jgi:hypothetical protein